MTSTPAPSTLTDDDLLCEARRLARRTCDDTTALVRVLMEVDARRLYLREGCASLFAWCVQVLHLEEGGAYNRIEVARVARRLPAVLDALDGGAVSLTAARLLAPHLTDANHAAVLTRARGCTTREVHLLVAELAPRPPVATFVRRLAPAKTETMPGRDELASCALSRGDDGAMAGAAAVGSSPVLSSVATDRAQSHSVSTNNGTTGHGRLDRHAPTPGLAPGHTVTEASLEPLSATRYKLQMTIAADTHAKIRHAQNLLRHTIPTCTVVDVLDRAVSVLVRELEQQRCALTGNPRRLRPRSSPSSRHIPAFVRRAVWQRDEGQCAFVGPHGRCRERAWLEFHHIVPHADGGPASVENISLRCRAHNAFEGELRYGKHRRTATVAGPAVAVLAAEPPGISDRGSAGATGVVPGGAVSGAASAPCATSARTPAPAPPAWPGAPPESHTAPRQPQGTAIRTASDASGGQRRSSRSHEASAPDGPSQLG